MTGTSFLKLHDWHCRGGHLANSARTLGLPKDNENSDSCNGLVIIMIIDEDKTKILMLCKLAREAEVQLVLGGRHNPTHANA